MAGRGVSVGAAACVGIGYRDKPHQASSFGLSIRPKDRRPRLDLFDCGFADPYRLPTVPHPSINGLVAHQVSPELWGGSKLLRHFQIACVEGQNALSVDLYGEYESVQNPNPFGKSARVQQNSISESGKAG